MEKKSIGWSFFKCGLILVISLLFLSSPQTSFATGDQSTWDRTKAWAKAKAKKAKAKIRRICKEKRRKKGDKSRFGKTSKAIKGRRGGRAAHGAKDSARRAKRSIDGRIKDINREVQSACRGGGASCNEVKAYAKPRLSRLQRQSNQFADSMRALERFRKQIADNQAQDFDYDENDMAAVKDEPAEEQENVKTAGYADDGRRGPASEDIAQLENELAAQEARLQGSLASNQRLSAAEQALAYHLPQLQMLPNGKSLSDLDSMGFSEQNNPAPQEQKKVGVVADPFKVVAAETTRSTASQRMPDGVGKIEIDRADLDWLEDDDVPENAQKRLRKKPIDVDKFRPKTEDVVVGKTSTEGYDESQTFTTVEGLSNWEKLRRRYEIVQAVMNK